MIRDIMKDTFFLSLKAEKATENDRQTADDLLETLIFHKEECVGMAANMIGVNKSIICVQDADSYLIMYNPEIIKCDGKYTTEEGCLSLTGKRKCVRYKSVKVKYLNEDFKERIKTFRNFTAEIIQHEIDHLNGIII